MGGVLIVTCERITKTLSIFSLKFFKNKLRQILFDRADISGNYFYTDREYRKIIQNCGFEYHFQLLSYPLHHRMRLMAGNHFGVKL